MEMQPWSGNEQNLSPAWLHCVSVALNRPQPALGSTEQPGNRKTPQKRRRAFLTTGVGGVAFGCIQRTDSNTLIHMYRELLYIDAHIELRLFVVHLQHEVSIYNASEQTPMLSPLLLTLCDPVVDSLVWLILLFPCSKCQ